MPSGEATTVIKAAERETALQNRIHVYVFKKIKIKSFEQINIKPKFAKNIYVYNQLLEGLFVSERNWTMV